MDSNSREKTLTMILKIRELPIKYRNPLFRGIWYFLGVGLQVTAMHTSQNEGIAPIYHLVCFCASMACFAVALAGDAKTVREIRAAQRLWRKEVLPYYVTMGLVLVFCAFVYTSSQMLVHGATDQTNPIRVFAIESLLENPAKPLAAREFLEQQNRD